MKAMSRLSSRPSLTGPVYVAAYVIMAAVGLPMLWLAYTRHDPNRWAVFGLLLTFVVLFSLHKGQTFLAGPLLNHLYLMMQTALVVALAFLGPSVFSALILLFMLSAEAAGNFPWRMALAWVGIFILLTTRLLLSVGSLEALVFVPVYSGGYFFFAAFANQTRRAEEAQQESQRLLGELQTAHQQLRFYADEVEELAVTRERNRLAREMHDALGHRLTVAAVQLEGAERLIPTHPQQAAHMVSTAREQVRTALKELRETVAALRTPPEADLPLSKALARLATEFERTTGIIVHQSLPQEIPPLAPALHLALYRTVQEALTNVQRHAHARQVWLTMHLDSKGITLQVRDDGQGIPSNAERLGFGLRGLRERAIQLGGKLWLESKPGDTRLSLYLPLINAEHEQV